MFATITSISPANSHRIWRQAPHGGVGALVSATIAMRRNWRWPSEIALKTATRSAHIVSPYVAFSMLQPVTTWPSAVSSAAPTVKVEYGACAYSRALRAAAIRSESLNDALEERDERAAHATRGFHDLVMHERLRQDAGGHVRDARDAK